MQDTQPAFSLFHQKLSILYDKHFPKTRVKLKYNNKKPWLSDGLRNAIKQKNKLYIKSIRIRTAQNETRYKTYRNHLKRILYKAEKDYYSNLISANKSNMKKTWSILKGIINKKKRLQIQSRFKLNNGSVTTDKTIICEKFNNFFIGVGPTLANKIPQQSRTPSSYLGNSSINSMFLVPVSIEEITSMIQGLKNSAPGHDDITADALRLCLPSITSPLVYILNLSLSQGVFPDELKIVNVIPLYKADDRMCFSNYLPVSLLCILSKVFEKVMYNRLISFLEFNKILIENQFGFRKKCSTYMALAVLIDKVIKSLESGDYMIGVFLDFSKAFDTVDHDILLKKLCHYGIRDTGLKWFQSYLSEWKQYVTYNDTKSSIKSIRCGVPQGSILGPLLFLIYINDLVSVCQHTMPILFADDTNLFINGDNLLQMVQTLNAELDDISNWLKANKLFLNVKKTHYMILTSKRTPKPDHVIKIEGHKLDEVQNTKFLGVYLDNKISWKHHIDYISGKVSRAIGMIVKARKFLTCESLKTLYYSFVYPFLIYCNHVWGKACPTSLKKLIMLQKKIVRIICGVNARTSCDPLFDELGFLRFVDINRYLIARFMYRWYLNDVPDLFHDFFTPVSEVHSHFTRQSEGLFIPTFKTNLGKTCLSYRGPFIWNKILRLKINLDTSEAVFMKTLKHCVKIGLLSD